MPISLIPYKKKGGTIENATKLLREAYREFLPLLGMAVILVALYVSFFILRRSAQGRVDELVREQDTLVASIDSTKVQEVKTLARQIRGLDKLVQSHVHTSTFFLALEKSVHNNIIITSLDLNEEKHELTIKGLAPSFDALGEQFLIWRIKSDFVEKVEITEFGTFETSGQLRFSTHVTINPRYFRE